MYELYPYFTNDGSVGLFSPEADDIYHSTYGALAEGYEKFVIPANLDDFLKTNNSIKVLDICYGIGYNTKSFLNYLIEKKYLKYSKITKKTKTKKILYSETIYTNNTSSEINNSEIYSNNISTANEPNYIQENLSPYNEEIYDDNQIAQKTSNKLIHDEKNLFTKLDLEENRNLAKIYIKALDIDENLFMLSPFFKQGNKNDKKHNKLNFHYEKISKLLNKDFYPKYTLTPEINAFLFDKISEKMPHIFSSNDIIEIFNKKQFAPFFNKYLVAYFRFLRFRMGKLTCLELLMTFLHNIYYKYLSNSYKRSLNSQLLNDLTFEPIVGDARQSLLNDKNVYDFIFLDAFTPAKCPALWSLEFFKLLKEHLSENGMILTYSNSAAIRNGMLQAGFHVGKIYSEEYKKFTGTIAVKNKSLIKYDLSEYDLGLINSKAGIFYRDENLNALNGEIIASREKEVEKSDRISSSRFIKDFRRKNEL